MTIKQKPKRSETRRTARPEKWAVPSGTHKRTGPERRQALKKDMRKKKIAEASRRRNRRYGVPAHEAVD